MTAGTVTSEHPALAALHQLDEDLDRLAAASLWSLTDAESLHVRAEIERIAARLHGARLRSTRDVDARAAAVDAGATSTTAWLVNVLHEHPGEAAREVRLAARLDDNLPVTRAALGAGLISPAAVAVVADTDQLLERCATAAERAEAESLLTWHAASLNVRHLQHAALHLRHRLDPDRDGRSGGALDREEHSQVEHRTLGLAAAPDGSARIDGHLDKEAAHLLRTALDPLARPRPGGDGRPDPRSPGRRRADALLDLVDLALRSAGAPTQAGRPVQLVVTTTLADLRQRPTGQPPARCKPGLLDTGAPLSVAAVRRLACDAQLVPAVLGTGGEPLDVGRASRDATVAIRRALELRDLGCAFPGCDRPARWCHAHHIWHWADGGPTSVDNLVLLCASHHRAVHHDGWQVRLAADRRPTFHPPPWIDPDRAPRRNISQPGHPGDPGDRGDPRHPVRRS